MKDAKMPASEPTTKPSHVFPGDSDGASLWRPKSRPAKYGEDEQPGFVLQLAQQEDVAEPEPDPGRAEHGRGDGDGRWGARLCDGVQHEREQEGGEHAAEHPDDAALLRTDEREPDADVHRRGKRA